MNSGPQPLNMLCFLISPKHSMLVYVFVEIHTIHFGEGVQFLLKKITGTH